MGLNISLWSVGIFTEGVDDSFDSGKYVGDRHFANYVIETGKTTLTRDCFFGRPGNIEAAIEYVKDSSEIYFDNKQRLLSALYKMLKDEHLFFMFSW